MRISTTQLEAIKIQLLSKDTSGFEKLISNADETVFQVIREQKLLLISSDTALVESLIALYRSASNKFFRSQRQNEQNFYCDFVWMIAEKRNAVKIKLDNLIESWKAGFSEIGLLRLLNAILESEQRGIQDEYIKFLEKNSVGLEHDKRAELNSFALHMANARSNDVSFAISNLINLTAQHASPFGIADEASVNEDVIVQLIYLSSSLVATQWLIDRISYGEWIISEIARNEKTEIRFQLTDLRFEMARDLGIRSSLISFNMKRNEKRWLHHLLENVCVRFLQEAIERYKGRDKLIFYMNRHVDALISRMNSFLEILDAEDELLVGPNQANSYIMAHYVVAAAFMCFSRAAEFCREHMAKNHDSLFLCYRVPVEVLTIFFENDREISGKLDNIINRLTCRIPEKQHFKIIQNRYIRIGEEVYGMSAFSKGVWVHSVRSVLYAGGATGNLVGKLWESFIADTLKMYGWSIVGLNIDMGKRLPDIDILAVKASIMLVIQVKSTYTDSVSIYEQWKAKNRIIKGTDQARKIADAIAADQGALEKITPSELLAGVRTIQPLVITNASIFNGWRCCDIPVISTGSLMQVLRGVHVNFKTSDNKVLSTKRYSSSEKLTDEEFLAFINEPLDWKMSNSNLEETYEHHEYQDLVFQIPHVKRADGFDMADVIPHSRINN